jgi:hypothetical protein
VDQCARQVEPALHAARVALGAAVGGVGQADQVEQLLRARPGVRPTDPVQAALQLQQLAPRLDRIEADLLERHADPPPYRGGIVDHVHARHAGAAGGRREERAEHPHGGGLAGAVGAEEAEHLPLGDGEVDVANRLDSALERPLEGACFDCRRHRAGTLQGLP